MVGNRQLLGGFFVIAFAMGYIVGRYSIPSPNGRSVVPSPPAGVTEPQPGAYWQVTAPLAQPQAEVFAKVLRDKGFRVSLTSETEDLTRVLVGPYPDRESLSRAKADLEGFGFHPVILESR